MRSRTSSGIGRVEYERTLRRVRMASSTCMTNLPKMRGRLQYRQKSRAVNIPRRTVHGARWNENPLSVVLHDGIRCWTENPLSVLLDDGILSRSLTGWEPCKRRARDEDPRTREHFAGFQSPFTG